MEKNCHETVVFPFTAFDVSNILPNRLFIIVLIRYALYKNDYHQYIVNMLCWV